MPFVLVLVGIAAGWVGHACLWTSALNYVYARPYPKGLLRIWRHLTGVAILGFPFLPWFTIDRDAPVTDWPAVPALYLAVCLVFGAILFPLITVIRLLRRPPAELIASSHFTLDLWKELGPAAIGDGKGRTAARLPFNDIYRVDLTDLTLALPGLPPEWDGLTILHLSDVHYHGTPSRAFHERVMDELATRWPNPDLVCLTGDFVDTDAHHTWIGPLLGRFRGREGNFAILGNHDLLHDPDRVRHELTRAGYMVLGNGWHEATIRGVPVILIGHEGPWFAPPPDVSTAPREPIRLGLSHTPDNFYWAQKSDIRLLLCGHVHGGQIRVPVITSIFVPSVYGRRFDMGVFSGGGTTMVVGRGLSGKEPLRVRCHPEVIRITLQVLKT